MLEITQQLKPHITKIYENEDAFIKYFDINVTSITRVSFGSQDIHIITDYDNTSYYFSINDVEEFFKTLVEIK